MRIILDKTMKTEYNKGMSEAPTITMKEAEEARKKGLVVLFRNPGEPIRILNKEESGKLLRDTAEKKKRYEAFLKALG